MRRSTARIIGAAFLGMVYAQDDSPPKIENIEIHTAYAAPIEAHTRYLTKDGSTTKYIGGNYEYLTELTSTITVDNKETQVTSKPQLEVTNKDGDTLVMLAPSVQDDLDSIVKGAIESCGGVARLRKRQDGPACVLGRLADASANDEALVLLNSAEWRALTLKLAEDAPAILTHYSARLATVAMRNRFYLMVGAAFASGLTLKESLPSTINKVPQSFKFGGGEVGKPKDDSPTETKAEETTKSSCGPEATADMNSPACVDDDCKGEKSKCTAEGDKKGCPCLNYAGSEHEFAAEYWDQEWRDFQQSYLSELLDAVPDVLPPTCFLNTHGDNFEGKPKADPSAFCHCSSMGETMTKGNFATMSGEGDEACTYTTMPDKTIKISTQEAPTPAPEVTSCRWDSVKSDEPYCTCNDDKIHGATTTTVDGKETAVCPDFAKPTDTSGGQKMVKIVLENRRTGAPGSDPFYDKCYWLFYSLDDDLDVRCQTDIDPSAEYEAEGITQIRKNRFRQWPSGSFDVKTQDGDCKYMNNGEGNVGALRCGDKTIKCFDDHDLDSADNNGYELCWDVEGLEDKRFGEGLQGNIEHMEVITCAWD